MPSDVKAVKLLVLELLEEARGLLCGHFIWPVEELDAKACSPWASTARVLGGLHYGLLTHGDHAPRRYDWMRQIDFTGDLLWREIEALERRERDRAATAATAVPA